MPRHPALRLVSPSRARRILPLVLVLVAAVSACGGGSTLSDPREIAKKAETAMSTVTAFHFQADATGQMVVGVDQTTAPSPSAADSASSGSAAPSASATGASSPAAGSPSGSTPASAGPSAGASGPTSTSVSLQGATASGDVDLKNGAASVQGTLPGLGMNGQIIVIGQDAYTRGPGQNQFHQTASSSLPFNPADSSGGPSVLQALLAMAADPSLDAKLVETGGCPEGACYHISLVITKDQASQRLGEGGIAVGSGNLDLWILTNSLRVAIAQFASSDPSAGNVWARVALSNYDQSVEIAAPPADQIAPSS